jgi:hypothetical protein
MTRVSLIDVTLKEGLMKRVVSSLFLVIVAGCGRDLEPAKAMAPTARAPAEPPPEAVPVALDAKAAPPPAAPLPPIAYPPLPQADLRFSVDGKKRFMGREELRVRSDHSVDIVLSSIVGDCLIRTRLKGPPPPLELEPDEVAIALNVMPGADGHAEVRWTYFDGALATEKVQAKLTGDLMDSTQLPALKIDLARMGKAQEGHAPRKLEIHGTISLVVCPGEPRPGDARLPPEGLRPSPGK